MEISLEAIADELMGLNEISKKLHNLIVRKHHVSYLGELMDDVGIKALGFSDAEITRMLGTYSFFASSGHGAGREIWDVEVEIQFDRAMEDLHGVLRRFGRYGAWEVSVGEEGEVTAEPVPPRKGVTTRPLAGALDVDSVRLEEDGLYAGFLVPMDEILVAVGLTDTGTAGELLTFAYPVPTANAVLLREVAARQPWGEGDAFRRRDYEADILRAVISPHVKDYGGEQVFRQPVGVPDRIQRAAASYLEEMILTAGLPHPEFGSLCWSNALAAADGEDFSHWIDVVEAILDEAYETRLRYYGWTDNFGRDDIIRVMDVEGLVRSWEAIVAEYLPTAALQSLDRHPAAKLNFDPEWRASVSAPLSGSIRALREWADSKDEDVIETVESAVRRYRCRLRWRGIETGYDEIASIVSGRAESGHFVGLRDLNQIPRFLEAARSFFGLDEFPLEELRWSDKASRTRLVKALPGERPLISNVPQGRALYDLSGVGYGTRREFAAALYDTMMEVDREVIERYSEANQRARDEAVDALDELETFFDS